MDADIDAAYHVLKHGARGVYDVQESGTTGPSGVGGISVLDQKGNVTAAVLDVLELVASYGAVLGTCHIRCFVAQGAVAEFGYCTVSPMWAYASIAQVAASIAAIGPGNCILVSDGGQRHNPMPCEGLRVFAQSLFEKGLGAEDVRRLMSDNPRRLLGL